LRLDRRHVQQLRARTGGRHDRARRHLHGRLPAPSRDAHVRHPQAPREGRARGEADVMPSELADRLRPRFPDVLLARDEVTTVNQIDDLLASLRFLQATDDLAFDFLSDLAATDWPGREPR